MLDPFSIHRKDGLQLGVKWGNHAPQLATEFLGHGHVVRGFGAPPGLIPRTGDELDPDAAPDSDRRRLQTLRAFDPDVLIAYDALSPAAVRAARVARSLGAALVLVEGGMAGGGSLRERFLNRLGEILWGPLVRRSAHAVVAVDEIARTRALDEGFDERLLDIVPHGVDTANFRPGLTSTLVARRRVRGRILLYVGRLLPARGLDVLLSAFARTVAQRGDWTLLIAGEGAELPHLRAQADRLGVAASVHWMGRPRDEELPGLISASTLVAAPFLADVSNARLVLRAMSCGVPALVSDLPRLRGLVTDDAQGLLVQPGSPGAWEDALRRASGAPFARERWAAAARERALETFGWSAVAARFEDILEQALERARKEENGRRSGQALRRRSANP